MAADRSGRAPLRGDAGAPAGAQSRGCLGADRRQPSQAGVPNPGRRAASSDRSSPGSRSRPSPPARADVRADGRIRGRDRAATVGAVRRSTARHRSRRRRRLHPSGVRERTAEAHQDAAEQRAVPLQAKALEALDRLRPRDDSPILFPNSRGGQLDFGTSAAALEACPEERPGSSRCATSTTCATPTPPSRSAPACRCSPSRGSWARASR